MKIPTLSLTFLCVMDRIVAVDENYDYNNAELKYIENDDIKIKYIKNIEKKELNIYEEIQKIKYINDVKKNNKIKSLSKKEAIWLN